MAYDYRSARDWVYGLERGEDGRVIAHLPTSANIRERALLLALIEFAPNMEPSRVALAKMLGLGTFEKPDEKAVKRLLKACVAKGFLKVEHRPGQRSRYSFTYNPGPLAPPATTEGAFEGEAPRPPSQSSERTQGGAPRPLRGGTTPPQGGAPRPLKQTNKADKKADKDPEPLRLELVTPKEDSAPQRVMGHYVARF